MKDEPVESEGGIDELGTYLFVNCTTYKSGVFATIDYIDLALSLLTVGTRMGQNPTSQPDSKLEVESKRQLRKREDGTVVGRVFWQRAGNQERERRYTLSADAVDTAEADVEHVYLAAYTEKVWEQSNSNANVFTEWDFDTIGRGSGPSGSHFYNNSDDDSDEGGVVCGVGQETLPAGAGAATAAAVSAQQQQQPPVPPPRSGSTADPSPTKPLPPAPAGTPVSPPPQIANPNFGNITNLSHQSASDQGSTGEIVIAKTANTDDFCLTDLRKFDRKQRKQWMNLRVLGNKTQRQGEVNHTNCTQREFIIWPDIKNLDTTSGVRILSEDSPTGPYYRLTLRKRNPRQKNELQDISFNFVIGKGKHSLR
ncbi:hypothetical protein ACTXT7_017178 [Hymenolepis weldensis]